MVDVAITVRRTTVAVLAVLPRLVNQYVSWPVSESVSQPLRLSLPGRPGLHRAYVCQEQAS